MSFESGPKKNLRREMSKQGGHSGLKKLAMAAGILAAGTGALKTFSPESHGATQLSKTAESVKDESRKTRSLPIEELRRLPSLGLTSGQVAQNKPSGPRADSEIDQEPPDFDAEKMKEILEIPAYKIFVEAFSLRHPGYNLNSPEVNENGDLQSFVKADDDHSFLLELQIRETENGLEAHVGAVDEDLDNERAVPISDS
ncbi:MAG TPA: hypothetical protein VFQ60_03155, partial [Patescibacteria group bacterium]|nr:hypothetical protein [Patescibacteria group bacterium]